MPAPLLGKNGDELTLDETYAIRALHRLAKRWPKTLTLLSMGSNLSVMHTGDPRFTKPWSVDRVDVVLDDIAGIPNDGGDW